MDRLSSGSILGGDLGRVAASGQPSSVSKPTRSGPRQAFARRLTPQFGESGREGLDESVVRVPPGRTGCIGQSVRARFDSSIADFDSGHRALSLRRRELGREVRRGLLDAPLYEPHD